MIPKAIVNSITLTGATLVPTSEPASCKETVVVDGVSYLLDSWFYNCYVLSPDYNLQHESRDYHQPVSVAFERGIQRMIRGRVMAANTKPFERLVGTITESKEWGEIVIQLVGVKHRHIETDSIIFINGQAFAIIDGTDNGDGTFYAVLDRPVTFPIGTEVHGGCCSHMNSVIKEGGVKVIAPPMSDKMFQGTFEAGRQGHTRENLYESGLNISQTRGQTKDGLLVCWEYLLGIAVNPSLCSARIPERVLFP